MNKHISKTGTSSLALAPAQSKLKLQYKIDKTWDNRTPLDKAEVTIIFKQSTCSKNPGLVIKVEAPFYDNPKLPDTLPSGRVDSLWDYEVEIFFLGSDQKYLEIELGPRGHYLVYYLEGVKNVTKSNLKLNNYKAKITANGQKWEGQVIIPFEYLPPNTSKFNAYAIHGSDPDREYLALFPIPGAFTQPDFHRLEPFQSIDLSKMM